jgi:hypothetical protein
MDLIKTAKPDSRQAKMQVHNCSWFSHGAQLVREAQEAFSTFLKELELSGYEVRKMRVPTVDMTIQVAQINIGQPTIYWHVGMGARLHYYVTWGTFYVAPEVDKWGPSTGLYEETFEDAQDAMDWVIDYIRSVENDGLP